MLQYVLPIECNGLLLGINQDMKSMDAAVLKKGKLNVTFIEIGYKWKCVTFLFSGE